jgi:hypothetical protein
MFVEGGWIVSYYIGPPTGAASSFSRSVENTIFFRSHIRNNRRYKYELDTSNFRDTRDLTYDPIRWRLLFWFVSQQPIRQPESQRILDLFFWFSFRFALLWRETKLLLHVRQRLHVLLNACLWNNVNWSHLTSEDGANSPRPRYPNELRSDNLCNTPRTIHRRAWSRGPDAQPKVRRHAHPRWWVQA